MKIASAQINSIIGDIGANLDRHYELIDIAVRENVDLIAFPEMSITGYCRKEANVLALHKNSSEVSRLSELARIHNIIIVAGAPIKINKELYIGAFIFLPSGTTEIYTKQFLHTGEELFYQSSFDYDPIIALKGEKICLAICADIDNDLHPVNAKKKECTVYIPGIFFSVNGIDSGIDMLKKYAKENSFQVLMSNYCGNLWGVTSGGKSGFWNEQGALLAQLPDDASGLIIAEKEKHVWKASVLKS